MARNGYKDPRITIQCQACNRPFDTPKRGAHWTRQPARFCSLYCRDYIAHNREWWCTWTPPKPKTTKPKPTPHQHLTHCNWCGIDMTTVSKQRYRYCTYACKRRASTVRREGRNANASGHYTWTDLTRLWLRFGKRCAYCRHPLALSDMQAEHVQPLSRGGGNGITNLLPSCGMCNSDKRDLYLNQWADDRVRRRLPPVVTTWEPGDPLYSHLATTLALY